MVVTIVAVQQANSNHYRLVRYCQKVHHCQHHEESGCYGGFPPVVVEEYHGVEDEGGQEDYREERAEQVVQSSAH